MCFFIILPYPYLSFFRLSCQFQTEQIFNIYNCIFPISIFSRRNYIFICFPFVCISETLSSFSVCHANSRRSKNILGKKSDESVYYSLSVDLNKRGFGNSNICEMEWFGLLCCVGESRVGYIFSKPILFLPMFFPDDQDFFKILTHICPHIITYFYTSSNVVYIFIFFKLSPR